MNGKRQIKRGHSQGNGSAERHPIGTAFPLGLLLAGLIQVGLVPYAASQEVISPPTAIALRLPMKEALRATQSIPVAVPSPARTNATADFNRYRLGPGDSLFVSVLRFPDLSFQGTVDLEGNLLVPLVGSLRLEGLTLAQARGRIQAELNRFVVNPQVDVILVAQRPVRVTVLGEVFRPGLYPLESPQLSAALVSAGGTTSQADLRLVRVRRVAPNGTAVEQDFDLFTPLKESTALPDVRMADGDTVIVAALTASSRASYDSDLIARTTLAQPQINIRVLNYSNSLGGSRSGRAIATLTLPNGSDFVDALTTISPNPDTANFGDIALLRYDPEQGRAVKIELNGRRAILGDASENPILQHNDVIVIGRNFISRVTYALNTFTQPFRDVLGFLLFFDAIGNSANDLFDP